MTKYLILALLLTSCTIDTRTYQAEVVRDMMFAGYDMTELEHNPEVIFDSCENIPCESSGCYDLGDKTIYLCVDNPQIISHEWAHYYLHQLHIPLESHHKLIGKLGY